jgi:hypothetical protein
VLSVRLTFAGDRRTAQAQPRAQERVYRKQTNNQGEGKPKGSGEDVAHAPTCSNSETLLLRPATDRTVKVHQSWTSKNSGSLVPLKRFFKAALRLGSRQRDVKSQEFSLT